MRRILVLTGLSLVSAAALLIFGCGGGYGGGGNYGGGGGGGGTVGGIVTSIAITPASVAVSVGATQQYMAVAKDSSGTTVANPTLTWNSSNTAVATVDMNGLASAVSVGSTNITASSTYLGTVYTSNTATLSVTVADAVMGTAAVGHALKGALVTLQDASGHTQTGVSSSDGRFQLSTAGMKAPFLLKADDGRGHVLFSAAVKDGVANIDTVTDLMLRAWYGAHGASPELAFADRTAHPAPDAKSLTILDAGFGKLLRDSLTGQGVDADAFSLLSTPFNADSTGFDHVLDATRVDTTNGHLSFSVSGSTTEVGFDHGALSFSQSVADGQGVSVSRLELP